MLADIMAPILSEYHASNDVLLPQEIKYSPV